MQLNFKIKSLNFKKIDLCGNLCQEKHSVEIWYLDRPDFAQMLMRNTEEGQN